MRLTLKQQMYAHFISTAISESNRKLAEKYHDFVVNKNIKDTSYAWAKNEHLLDALLHNQFCFLTWMCVKGKFISSLNFATTKVFRNIIDVGLVKSSHTPQSHTAL